MRRRQAFALNNKPDIHHEVDVTIPEISDTAPKRKRGRPRKVSDGDLRKPAR